MEQLVSKKFEKFLEDNNIKSVHTSIYKPTSNGIAERINGMIAEILRMHTGEYIDEIINKMHVRLNLNYKRSILHSPFEKMHRFNFFDPDEKRITEFKEHKLANVIKNENKKRYAVNDQVYVKKFNAKKNEKQYEGSYTITEVGDKNRWIKVAGTKEWIHVRDIK